MITIEQAENGFVVRDDTWQVNRVAVEGDKLYQVVLALADEMANYGPMGKIAQRERETAKQHA